jgi:hypothetical protein
MTLAIKANAITSSVNATLAHKAIAKLPKVPKASAPAKTIKPTVLTWQTDVIAQVATYCVGTDATDFVMVQIKRSIAGQPREDVRAALLSAVSLHYAVALVPSKSPKKTEAGKPTLDQGTVKYERAKRQLQRLLMALLPAESTVKTGESEDDEAGEILHKKEALPVTAPQQALLDAIDSAISKSGFTDTKKDKKMLIEALRMAIAAYK